MQQAQFPDYTKNYQTTVVLPAQKAQEAAQAALEAQQAQTPPPVVEQPVNDYKLFIYMHESGNNPRAVNRYSGACGLGQALPCSKMGCSLDDYACQDAWFTGYMERSYGTWQNAYYFWVSHSWW